MSLPIYQSGLNLLTLQTNFVTMQTNWAAQLDPLLAIPMNSGGLLKSVKLLPGLNTINHLLGKKLTGYYITRMRNAWSNIYDTQDQNQTPTLTLTLVASGPVVVDVWVF